MKRYGGLIILLFIIFLGILFISTKGKATIPKSIDKFQIDRTAPKNLIEQFYNGEKKLDETVLKQFFYKSISDTSMMKLKIKCFDINKIVLDKVIKIEEKDNLAVVSCYFNTFLNGIDLPRPDMEVVNLIKEPEGWYIISNLEDIKVLSIENKQWLEDTESLQKTNMWNSSFAMDILNRQANFDDSNKERLQQGSIKLKEELKNRELSQTYL
ncbi:MAG: hypothetical protein H7Y18_10800 [Clostridiaceae bacterium]|nr:hypothetical protein [Clostridiaceae bacterium]